MFARPFRLFSLFGFEVRIDASWFIVAVLITWSLAVGVFPGYFPELSPVAYWWMGAAGAAGLFLSIVFHEMCHSLVARRFGIPMRGITLFIFGGVAEMDREPPSPRSEFLMAIAGPLSSGILGGIFVAFARALEGSEATVTAAAVLAFLGSLNFILALFNMVPAFPLDGGRVLRSALWGWKGDIRWATRIASTLGKGFGVLLMLLGAVDFFFGNFIGGIWLFLIGLFIRNASAMSYHQLLIRTVLEGEPVERFMSRDPVTVRPSTTVQDLVEEYIYRRHHKLYPVVEDGVLRGCITVDRVKEVPREEWGRRTVGEIAVSCSPENTVGAREDAMKALSRMSRTGRSRLMVLDGGHLLGILALKDLLRFLALKLDLEGPEARRVSGGPFTSE